MHITNLLTISIVSRRSCLTVDRVVWLMILLTSCGLFTYLIASKMAYLLAHPKNVDVSVEFKQRLAFPAVTICNQNPYRYLKNKARR